MTTQGWMTYGTINTTGPSFWFYLTTIQLNYHGEVPQWIRCWHLLLCLPLTRLLQHLKAELEYWKTMYKNQAASTMNLRHKADKENRSSTFASEREFSMNIFLSNFPMRSEEHILSIFIQKKSPRDFISFLKNLIFSHNVSSMVFCWRWLNLSKCSWYCN